MNYIYSTASNDTVFPIWIKAAGSAQSIRAAQHERKILIRGKANVINTQSLITPKGVVSEVTDDELAELQKMSAFNASVKAGFYTVEKKKVEVEKVVKDMTKKDKSAQKVKQDFVDANAALPEGSKED